MDFKLKPELENFSNEDIEEKIARGLAEAERGETIDCDEAFRQLRAYTAERRERR
jgi:predicted transcriptional regulator